MNRSCLTGLLCSLPTICVAADVVIRLPQAPSVTRNVVTYACEGLPPIRVEYITAGSNALAVVPVSGEALVFAGVLSGSGARYAAGPYIWWTKGPSADLYDQRQGDGAKPIGCQRRSNASDPESSSRRGAA
jgi:membrane-bound inhibitor of C-type lysozyme